MTMMLLRARHTLRTLRVHVPRRSVGMAQKAPLVWLQDELAAMIVAHNNNLIDRRTFNMCAATSVISFGGACMLESIALSIVCAFATAATWGALDAAKPGCLHPNVSNVYVTMPPAAIIRAAHAMDKELALTSLLRFVIMYPDSMTRDASWHAEVVRDWPASAGSGDARKFGALVPPPSDTFSVHKRRDEER